MMRHLLTLGLTMALLACGGPAVASERLNLHLAFGARTPLYGTLVPLVVQEAHRLSAGALLVRVHEPGALVPRFGYLDAVAQGSVDAAWGTPAVLSGRAPEAALFTGVPFGLDPAAHLAWVRDGAGRPFYDAMYARYGVVGLPCVAVGPDGPAWLRRPLGETAPFRGLRMRAFGLPARILGRLGASTAQGFGADLIVGLGTGAFDGAEAGVPASDVATGLQTVASVFLYPSALQPTTLLDLVINAARWDALAPAATAALVDACRAVGDAAIELNRSENDAALGVIAAAGVAISAPSPATVAALREGWRLVRTDQSAESPAFDAVLAAYPDRVEDTVEPKRR